MRSRIVLLAAAGQSNTAIAQRSDTRPHTVGKYLTNIIEQDHCGIKSRTRLMLSFKNCSFVSTRVTSLSVAYDQATPALWKTVLAA
jgi:transposase-like protein